jgi:hypothetical protein
MQTTPSRNTWTPIAIGLLCVAGAVALSKDPPSCDLGACLRDEAPATTSTRGDENRSLADAESQVRHADDFTFDSPVLRNDD